jgi:hypothetical protein
MRARISLGAFLQLSALVVLSACGDTVPPSAYSAGSSTLSAAVYAAAIADMQTRYPGTAVISLRTSLHDIGGDRWPDVDQRVRQDPLIDTTLWRALAQLNSHPQDLNPVPLAVATPQVVQAHGDQEAALASAGYMSSEFTDAFPGAGSAIHVSAVAFSPDEHRAVVYVGLHCGGLCGQGAVYALELREAQWQVTHYLSLWVA